MKSKYDVIIVGAGPTGIFASYELMKKCPNLSVLLVDKGHNIYDRNCPILNKLVDITFLFNNNIHKNNNWSILDDKRFIRGTNKVNSIVQQLTQRISG